MAEYTIDKIEYGGNVYKLQDNVSGFITSDSDEKLKLTDAYNDTTYLPIIGTSDTAAATRQHTGEYRIYMTDTDIGLYLGSDYTYGNRSGSIYLYGTGTSWTKITAPDSSINRVINLPNKGGTIALTTDIPTVSDKKLEVAAVTSGTTYYPIVGTGTTAATRQFDTTGFQYKPTDGTAGESLYGMSLLTLGNTKNSTQDGWKQGILRLCGINSYYIDLRCNANLTQNRTITLPDKTGTIALTDDIPTVPTITLNGSSTTSPSFYAPTGAGTSGQYLKSSGSGAPTWTNFPTIPSITLNGSSTTSPSFYAPTGAGTSGQYLKSNGSGAPSWTNFPTIPSITLNGSSTTSPSFYAPTSVGTSGNYLKSSGSGAPTWEAFPTIPSISLNGSSTTSPSFYAPTTAGTNGYYLTSNGSGAPSWTSFPTTISILQANVLDTNDTAVGSIAIDSSGAVEISNHNTQTKAVLDGGFSIVGNSGEIFEVDSSGNVNTTGSIYLPNGQWIYGKNSGGTLRQLMTITADNNYFFGYGSYVYSEGSTYFDGNSVNIRSKGNITTNAPIVAITGGYKLLTIDAKDQDNVSISASSVNANIAISVTKTGYKPIGVVGYSFVNATTSGANYSSCVVTRVRVSGNNVNMTIKNNASSAAKIHIYLDVLYVNTTQGV